MHAAGEDRLSLPRSGPRRILRPVERCLPRAPVGRAQLAALERRENPQHFSRAADHAQIVHTEPPDPPLVVDQVGRPKRNLLDRVQDAELFGEFLAGVRQHRDREIAKGRVFSWRQARCV